MNYRISISLLDIMVESDGATNRPSWPGLQAALSIVKTRMKAQADGRKAA